MHSKLLTYVLSLLLLIMPSPQCIWYPDIFPTGQLPLPQHLPPDVCPPRHLPPPTFAPHLKKKNNKKRLRFNNITSIVIKSNYKDVKDEI